MDEIRILVVDDDPLQRQGITRIIGSAPGFSVVAEAENGLEAVGCYSGSEVDVVLLDLMMPIMSGVEATKQIIAGDPKAKIVVMTSLVTEEYLVPALAAGASGYLNKGIDAEELFDTLRGAVAGELKLSSPVIRSLVDLVVNKNGSAMEEKVEPPADQEAGSLFGRLLRRRQGSAGRNEPLVELTEREQSIIERLASGHSNGEIAKELFISEATVKANLARVMDKLHVDNRVQVLVEAVRLGLVAIEMPIKEN